MPTTMLTIPASISSCVIESRSHFTKNASDGVMPWNAPCRKRACRNHPAEFRISAHRTSSLGSKTTHASPRERLSSMNSASRRIVTYFHPEAALSAPSRVRAPQTIVPTPGNVRSVLTPSSLRDRASSRDSVVARPVAPTIAASRPAGARQTPRVRSDRAMIPATAPDGASSCGAPPPGATSLGK